MPFSFGAFMRELDPDGPPRSDPVFDPPRLTPLRKPIR